MPGAAMKNNALPAIAEGVRTMSPCQIAAKMNANCPIPRHPALSAFSPRINTDSLSPL
jgi:hypothetical protein